MALVARWERLAQPGVPGGDAVQPRRALTMPAERKLGSQRPRQRGPASPAVAQLVAHPEPVWPSSCSSSTPAPPAPPASPMLDGAGMLALVDAATQQTMSSQAIVAAWAQLAARRRSKAAWHRAGGPASPTALEPLIAITQQQMGELSADQLGCVARSSVLLGTATPSFMHVVQQAACTHAAADYTAEGLSQLAWAAAQLRQPPLPAFAEHIRGVLGQQEHGWRGAFAGAPPARVLMLLWAVACQGWPPCPQLLDAAAACLPAAQLARMSSKSLVTLLWTLGTLRAPHEDLLQAVSLEVVGRMEQALAANAALPAHNQPSSGSGSSSGGALRSSADGSAVGASSRSDSPPQRNTPNVRPRKGQREQLGTQQLGQLLWACGRLGHRHERLLRLATTLLLGRVGELAAGDVARVLWGLAQLGFAPPQLLAEMGNRLEQPGAWDGFTWPQLAMLTHGLSALGCIPGQRCIDLVADACLAQRDALDPQSLSLVLWNLSRMGLEDEGFYLSWMPVIQSQVEAFAIPDLANVVRVYAKQDAAHTHAAAIPASPVVQLFEAIAIQAASRMQPGDEVKDVLRIVTAFQQLGVDSPGLLAAVDEWANARLAALTPAALALALWSFARLGNRSPRLLETAAGCAAAQASAFTPVQLAQVSWSFATLGHHPGVVLEQAASVLAQHTEQFSDKAAANVLWALATLRHRPSPAVLDAIACQLQGRLRSFGAQALANIAWAFATFRHTPPPGFLRAIGDAAATHVRAFEPQGLSLTAWALATFGTKHAGFLLRVVQDCLQRDRLGKFEAQHLSNLLWGMSKVGFYPGTRFLAVAAAEAELRVSDCKPQEVFNLLHAYSRFGFTPHALLPAAGQEAALRASAFSPQEIAGSLWALSRLGAVAAAAPLAEAAEQQLVGRGDEFDDRHLALLCWAWSQLGHSPAPEAAAALLAAVEVRLSGMEAQTLATLAPALAQMSLPPEAALELRQGVLPAALLARTLEVLPRLKGFEYAQVVWGLAALGPDPGMGQQLLGEEGLNPAAAQALEGAASRGSITAGVQLLSAMQRWGRWPEPAFSIICSRLKKTSPGYEFQPATLALLGQVLHKAPPPQAARLSRMRSALRRRAVEAAGEGQAELPRGGRGDAGAASAAELSAPTL